MVENAFRALFGVCTKRVFFLRKFENGVYFDEILKMVRKVFQNSFWGVQKKCSYILLGIVNDCTIPDILLMRKNWHNNVVKNNLYIYIYIFMCYSVSWLNIALIS